MFLRQMKYEAVIGLEVHVQSKTKSKMFCGCSTNYFGKEPNSHTCPVCLGLPGALPVPNSKAIDLCVKTALALNCKINKETKFDRKSYFYPDLPKGFQISQYDQPIGEKGFIEIEYGSHRKKIGVTRVHQEEDTAKSIHTNGKTLLDFNKSGVPLIEIVTEPDMRSVDEVTAFAKLLKLIIQYIEVSDTDMEKGQMRFEINMSLRPIGETELPSYKVEVKNIGSISVLKKVVEKEFLRQQSLLQNGETPTQETRGLVDMSGTTVSQRGKETEADYRYFPEPDIPCITFSQKYIDSIKKSLCELPQTRLKRYVSDFGVDRKVAEVLITSIARANFFEKAISYGSSEPEIIEVSKIMIGDFADLSKKHADILCKPEFIADLARLVLEKKVSRVTAKDILKTIFETGKSPEKIVSKNNLEVVDDTDELESMVDKVISENAKAVSDAGKNQNAIMFLVGQVMKISQGRADPEVVKSMLSKRLLK
ncbi:MAG: Asp-tRNA(Asn)/Glu-tRNA(Gln) amidotransferase subunit GatB [Patescibacteria group bacterium]|nr:Asp-tRNA(Asn)/Glu-tRNA(Gln) amidotransferase subunit GatB [Patescibacteria group bacterium]